MFIVILDYVADLSEIDASLDAHVTWLATHYETGLFLASGRRDPRVGGVIFAAGNREDVDSAVATDPFALKGLAHHTIIEFHPSAFGGPLDTEPVRTALS